MRSLLWFLLALPTVAAAQKDAATATVHFSYDHAGMAVPHYELTLREDGTGSYTAKAEAVSPINVRYQTAPRPTPELLEVSRPITVSAATTASIFSGARALNLFHTSCASKRKVASTGSKTVSYTGADGQGSCTYDYTENKQLGALTSSFYAMANMLDSGRKLESDHRFDRLGLDSDMETLVKCFKDGEAVEPGLIAATLKSIVDDTELIQRVRLRAAALLEQVPASDAPPPAKEL